VLGADLIDFLRRWTPLGCPGPEDWQWLPFTSKGTTMLDPDGEAARAWRETLGLELPTWLGASRQAQGREGPAAFSATGVDRSCAAVSPGGRD